jgi:inorganic pyrophosphatase
MRVDKIEVGEEVPTQINVIIEIAKGSRNKYELDKESGAMMLDRVLHTSMVYPADYGFTPHTLCDDGDPLDVLVLVSHHTFPGCVINVRPIGVLKMSDEKGIDDKILAVAVKDPNYYGVTELEQVPEGLRNEIGHFFEQYKALEKGKFSTVVGWFGAEEAKKIVFESIEMYKEKNK